MPDVLNNPSVLRVRAALETAGIVPAIIGLPGAARTAQAAAAGHPHTVMRLKYEELLRITGGLSVEAAA